MTIDKNSVFFESSDFGDDLFIENIIPAKEKKAKLNSGAKGKRAERFLVNIFNERFKDILEKNPSWGKFSRSIGSGNRSGQKVDLSTMAGLVFTSDLTCPPSFKFSVESKCGYNHVDMNSFFDGGNKTIDGFLNQVVNDAKKIKKEPLLIWKKDRRPCLAFLIDKENNFTKLNYCSKYNEWTIINLDELIKLEDKYFFIKNFKLST